MVALRPGGRTRLAVSIGDLAPLVHLLLFQDRPAEGASAGLHDRLDSGSLGGLDRVAEEHRDRGGAYAADARGDGAGYLGARLVDIRQQAAALVADAGADHRRARFDVFGLDDAGDAGRRHQDVGSLGVARPVGYPGVDDGYRRVGGGALLGHQHRQGAAQGGAAAEDDQFVAGYRDVVMGQQRLDAGRGAGERAGHAERQPAPVERVHAVDVLVGVDGLQGGVVVEVAGDRV